jgi:acetyl esterase/lipase
LDIVGRRANRQGQKTVVGPPGGALNHYDIPYASLPGVEPEFTSLDIYSPEAAVSRPIVLYVHGGGWKEGDKGSVGDMPAFFVEKKFLFISINHRLTPSAWFPAHLKDLASAISWTFEHCVEYGGNPANLFIMGSSSGAHMVSTIALDPSYLASVGLRTDVIKGVISIDTRAYDIPFLLPNLPRGGKRLYRTTFGSNETALAKASPITYVDSSGYLPPFLIAYSGNDSNLKIQAERFARRLGDGGGDVVLAPAPSKTHLEISGDIGRPGDPISRNIIEFLEKHRRL